MTEDPRKTVKTLTQHDPLTDAELDRLGDFLKGCKGGRAMNVEQLDGFFAALITGPEIQAVLRRGGGELRCDPIILGAPLGGESPS